VLGGSSSRSRGPWGARHHTVAFDRQRLRHAEGAVDREDLRVEDDGVRPRVVLAFYHWNR
jgi:hypothetical protein